MRQDGHAGREEDRREEGEKEGGFRKEWREEGGGRQEGGRREADFSQMVNTTLPPL